MFPPDRLLGSSEVSNGVGVVARDGRVRESDDPVEPWVVEFPAGEVVTVVSRFVRELVARDAAASTCRSYAFDLLRWWRFLAAIGRPWAMARREDVRDFVLWLRTTDNPQRRPGHEPQGAVNARTGKRLLTAGYAPATINHALAVVSGFYAFLAEHGEGPVVNPVPVLPPGSGRLRHQRWDESFRQQPRAPYRQRQPDRVPRAIDDALLEELFAALGCNRDRALIAFYLSSGARASELLGLRHMDVDWGDQTIAVVSKGWRTREVIPAAPDAFVWLRLYLGEDTVPFAPADAVWRTRREPRRPLTYGAVRALLQRVNAKIGANLTVHDFRHTCALRLANDPRLSITDVQAVLRHRRLTTTQRYVQPRLDEVIDRVRAHHLRPPDAARVERSSWGSIVTSSPCFSGSGDEYQHRRPTSRVGGIRRASTPASWRVSRRCRCVGGRPTSAES